MKKIVLYITLFCSIAYLPGIAATVPESVVPQFIVKSTDKNSKSAFSCSAAVSKPQAWANYDVKITMLNYIDKKPITEFNLSAAQGDTPAVFFQQKSFDCKKFTQIQFNASFTPIIWSTNKGRIYLSNKIWDISNDVAKALQQSQTSGSTAKVEISIVFPSDFAGIPQLIEGAR